jgi:hypothetical protein
MRPFTGKSGFTKTSPGTQTIIYESSTYDFLLANIHALESSDDIKVNRNDKPVDPPPEYDPPDTPLFNAPKSMSKLIPCHV